MKRYLALLLCVVGLPVNGAQFVDEKPMTSTTSVGEVKGGVIPLPVITWYGDVATVLANGSTVDTKPDSLFAAQQLQFKIVRKDVFQEQVNDYVSGKTPYLRGTVGMINQALGAFKDPRVKPVVIYQLTWSTGGDVLVVRPSVNDASDLKGKTILVQAYGPHVDFMVQTLRDAGVSLKDVKIKYCKDITGTDESPASIFASDQSIDAVFCIAPDANDLTGGPGKTGTGSEKSVKGARYLMSTKSADRVIADVYAVRSDYLQSNPTKVEGFVNALMNAQEKLSELEKNPSMKVEYDSLSKNAAQVFLDSKDAVDVIKGMQSDCTFVGYQGNVKFFNDPSYPRRFEKVSSENQDSLILLGVLKSKTTVASAGFDYEKIKSGLRNTVVEAETPRFDSSAVASLLAKRGEDLQSVFAFDVQFAPNMSDFDESAYKEQFEKVLEMAATYSGAILVIEGNTDPNDYLKVLRDSKSSDLVVKQKKQSNLNKSLERANRVKEGLLSYINSQGVKIDESQVTTVGNGCMKPKQGVEKAGRFKGEPLPSTSEAQWRANMRVTFSIRNVEAESDVFTPVE